MQFEVSILRRIEKNFWSPDKYQCVECENEWNYQNMFVFGKTLLDDAKSLMNDKKIPYSSLILIADQCEIQSYDKILFDGKNYLLEISLYSSLYSGKPRSIFIRPELFIFFKE